jgi:UDP-glucose 4-epimerase
VIFIAGDIRNANALGSALAGANRVAHLAAFSSVVESVEAPQTNFEMNVIGTFNVLNQ